MRVSHLKIEIPWNNEKAETSSPLQKSVLDTLSDFKQSLQNSFNSGKIDPIKALSELERLKKGEVLLHEFLADHELTVYFKT